jgi:hypothetical protein
VLTALDAPTDCAASTSRVTAGPWRPPRPRPRDEDQVGSGNRLDGIVERVRPHTDPDRLEQ